jgi:hypothetical protein
MVGTSCESGELLIEESPDSLLPANLLFSTCKPPFSSLLFPSLRSLLFSVLDGVPLPKIPSLKKPPPPPDLLIPLLGFLSLATSVELPSSLFRPGVKNLSFNLSPLSLQLAPLPRLSASELLSSCRRPSENEEKLTSAAADGRGSAEERCASPDMACKRLLAGVEAVAAGSVRSLLHCSRLRLRGLCEREQLACRGGKSWGR